MVPSTRTIFNRLFNLLMVLVLMLSFSTATPVHAAGGQDLLLLITHSPNPNFTQGQTGSFTVIISNVGTDPTSGLVSMTFGLNPELTATAISGTGWSCVLGTLTCTRSDALAVGDNYSNITVSVNVASNASPTLSNDAVVDGGGEALGTIRNNNSYTDNVPVVQFSNLTVLKSHLTDFQQMDTGQEYTITVHNSGGADTSGTTTVVDTLPTGLTATGMSGSGWNCTLGTLTCTSTAAVAPGIDFPAITLTVNVASNAPALVTNSVTVSGGGEIITSDNTATDPTDVIQLADLHIINYEVQNLNGDPLISPSPNVAFQISVTVENQGTGDSGAGVFYRSAYVDRNPNLLTIDSDGCLINPALNPPTGDTDWGDFQRQSELSGLPAGTSDSLPIEFNTGLTPGSHQIWLYADPTCIVTPETDENNNAYGPITVNVGSYASGPTDVDATIGGTSRGVYHMEASTGQVLKYNLDGGPVVISSDNGVGIVASLNQWRKRVGTTEWTGISQSMGLPVEQVSNKYVMPRYDYSNTSKQYNALMIANVDVISRDITVTIGGVVKGVYTLAPSASQFINYPGFAGGPVVVSSDTGAKIVASLYELRRDPAYAGWNGQSEMMGLPWTQISDRYLIPMYFGALNPSTLDARLFIANVDSIDTIVEIKVAGVSRGTYSLASNTGQVLKYNLDGGPVEIASNNGANIVASLNQWRKRVGTTEWTGISQSMGLPVEQVSNKYVMPRYDYSNTSKQYNALMIANVDVISRDITVTIGGVVKGVYTLAPSASQFINYPGFAGGPVVVSSDTGAKIVASLYELRRDPAYAGWNGQSEMMGLPWTQISDRYLIPMYFGALNPSTLDARLFIANP